MLHVHHHRYLWETVKSLCHFPPDGLSQRMWFQCQVQSDLMWSWCMDLFSSSWRRDFVTCEVLISMSLCDLHKLSYAPQGLWLHVRIENVWLVWSQDCSDTVLHDPAHLTALSVSDWFLRLQDFWTNPYFGGFCVLRKVTVLTKWIIHASVKNTWIYSILLWALNLGRLNLYLSDGH